MKQPDPEKVRDLAERARQFAELKDQPGWQQLEALVAREEDRYWANQMQLLKRRQETDPFEQAVMAETYDRLRWLFAHPDKAEETLRRAIDKAERWQQYQKETV